MSKSFFANVFLELSRKLFLKSFNSCLCLSDKFGLLLEAFNLRPLALWHRGSVQHASPDVPSILLHTHSSFCKCPSLPLVSLMSTFLFFSRLCSHAALSLETSLMPWDLPHTSRPALLTFHIFTLSISCLSILNILKAETTLFFFLCNHSAQHLIETE